MNPKAIAVSHFAAGKVMQIATLHEGNPRVSSVFFVPSSDNTAVYWLSEPDRRHSSDIRNGSHIGAAIVIKSDQPVIGLQFTGVASEVTDPDEVKEATIRYIEKYDGTAEGFYERFIAGTNKHHVYKMVITELELFDEANFPGGKVITVPLS